MPQRRTDIARGDAQPLRQLTQEKGLAAVAHQQDQLALQIANLCDQPFKPVEHRVAGMTLRDTMAHFSTPSDLEWPCVSIRLAIQRSSSVRRKRHVPPSLKAGIWPLAARR